MNSNVQVLAQECSNYIREGLSSFIQAGNISEEVKELTVESLTKVMKTLSSELEAKRLLPSPGIEDLKVDIHKDSYYRVSFKNTLNSIHFITGEERIETKLFKANNEINARMIAQEELGKSKPIVDVVFDHEERDNTRINVEYLYRPVISINRFVANFTVVV